MIRLALWAAAGLAVAVTVTAAVVLTRPDTAPPAAAPQVTAPQVTVGPTVASTVQGRTTNPPWDAPTDASAAVAAAGLPMLGEEGNALHIHAHLDIFVNGSPVPVPADIGVDHARGRISPLHSHDTTGVVHVESPDKDATFTLGQFFTQWQVSLAADHIGGLVASDTHRLEVYVNGKLRTGDPAGIVLVAHDEIAIVYGTDAQRPAVPDSYQWTNGL
jgi:hypothetical protein